MKKTINICKHDRLMQVGYWDGIIVGGPPVCGPLVKCELCDKEIHLTWEEWRAIPEKKKVRLEDTPEMKERRRISEKTRKVIEDVLKEPEIAKMKPEEFVKRYNEFIEKIEKRLAEELKKSEIKRNKKAKNISKY